MNSLWGQADFDQILDTNMSEMSPMTPVISRGLALHKMIRSADSLSL